MHRQTITFERNKYKIRLCRSNVCTSIMYISDLVHVVYKHAVTMQGLYTIVLT